MIYQIELFEKKAGYRPGEYFCTIKITTDIAVDDWGMDLYTRGAGILTQIGTDGYGSCHLNDYGTIFFYDGSLLSDIILSLSFGSKSNYKVGDEGFGSISKCAPPQPLPLGTIGIIKDRY